MRISREKNQNRIDGYFLSEKEIEKLLATLDDVEILPEGYFYQDDKSRIYKIYTNEEKIINNQLRLLESQENMQKIQKDTLRYLQYFFFTFVGLIVICAIILIIALVNTY